MSSSYHTDRKKRTRTFTVKSKTRRSSLRSTNPSTEDDLIRDLKF